MGVITILGLIFMNFMFTLVLDLGIMLIIWLSKCFDKSKKKKWVRILINCVAVFILLCAIGGVGVTAWFLDYVVKHAPEFNEDALTMTQTTIVYDSNGVEYAELGKMRSGAARTAGGWLHPPRGGGRYAYYDHVTYPWICGYDPYKKRKPPLGQVTVLRFLPINPI